MPVKPIHNQDFKDFLESNFNLMRIAINGFEDIFKYLYEDLEKLKGVPLKPDRKTALALTGYLNLKGQKAEEIINTLCGIELQRYFDWIDAYCKEYKTTRELVLKRILEGEI